jgi:D-alanyl-D-alanine endopeptidase (penicillin-binding protein 7)
MTNYIVAWLISQKTIFLFMIFTKLKRRLIIITLIFFVNLLIFNQVLADSLIGPNPLLVSSVVDNPTLSSDSLIGTNPLLAPDETQTLNLAVGDFTLPQSLGFFDNHLTVAVPPNFISGASQLTVKKLAQGAAMPWSLDRISPIYEITFSPTFGFDNKQALTISVSYDQDNDYFKQVYYFDQEAGGWKALPTTDFPQDKLVKAALNKTAVQLAVFAKPGVLTQGQASWYKYKGGLFAASPDFPQGSKLRVTNTDNGKAVEVTVNDWGPDRSKYPNRAVDLDKVAFSAIADPADGLINVAISPIELTTDRDGRVLGVKAASVSNQPQLSSRSVVIINEDTGDIVLDKNGQDNLPLASLTKIMAIEVFLDTKPDLNKKVAYNLQDEKYNYLYCKPSEAVKVTLKQGEKLTIKDLIYSALVGSANNVVETLVRVSGLSRQEFIKRMNQQAKDWGAVHTKFVEPTGLSSANVSTALDYALILQEAAANELIAKASATPSYTFKTSAGRQHTIRNTNQLIIEQAQANLQAEKFPISASKTGYLVEAGYCLATRIEAGGSNYIIVTLGSPTRTDSFNEMADLIRYISRTI